MGLNYAEKALIVAKELREQKFSELAQKIEDAIRGGATGTEILWGVRYYLKQVPKAASKETQAKTRVILIETDTWAA